MEPSTSNPQYDSLLGGHQILPSSLPLKEFITARFQEISALTEVIETPSNAIVEIRSFPKHMRRRAMSHNIKRIPKRLRELHATLREKSNTREGSSKIPRRKYRRRPKELLKEYNRRQKEHVWLETHIWHAKRFKMVTKWGYKIPLNPCDKSFRACYRASANHCLLQDISYLNCIEISGLEETLLSGLSRHSNGETGLTFAAKATISGAREGLLMFYRANKYPFGAIGEINFFWKPAEATSADSQRILWLWCHPGIHKELLEELINSFNLIVSQEEPMESNEALNDDKEMKKIELRNVPFVRVPKYVNKEGVTMVILKDTLNRFRLIGPLSHSVLSQCLKPICLTKRQLKEDQDWVKEYYLGDDGKRKEACNSQLEFWSSIKQYYSPAQLTPRCIIPLTIIDPRFIMPSSRTKAVDESSSERLPNFDISGNTVLLDSPLWSPFIRDKVTMNKLSTEQLNRMRSDKLVPGLEMEFCEDDELDNLPCLPIILIQRPGSQESNKRLGYGSGWDVISPCGYAMPLWLSFVLSGARAGGLKEAEAFKRESVTYQNYHHPDTAVGKEEEHEKRIESTNEFFRLPPAKRRNYIKLNIPAPFHCPWSVLTRDWENIEDFYILRNKKFLYLLQNCNKEHSQNINLLNENNIEAGALIPVKIDLNGKGVLGPNAHICLPQKDDLSNPPKEPKKKDEFYQERCDRRLKHKKLLRKLTRKRHSANVAEREECLESKANSKDYKQIILENSSDKYVQEHAETMRSLWLPEFTTIKDVCIRKIIGFVVTGDFCFTEGTSSGIGYVTLPGFKEYLQSRISNKNLILVRCTTTDQYRLASINIIY